MIKKIFTLLLVMITITACGKKEAQEFKEEKFLFGTYIGMTVYHDDANIAKEAMEAAFDEMERIDMKFNSHWKGSDIDILNQDPENGITLDDEGDMLFDEVDRVYNLSDGRFDITVEPLMELWGFGEENPTLPTKEEMAEVMKKVDYDLVIRDENHISLKAPLRELNTGAFLKGYATARAKVILAEAGIESAFVTTISSMETLGAKPKGPWRIGIQDPSSPRDILDIVNLDGQAMGISGDYQTYVEIDGEKYHHILDPHTGYPVKDKKLVAVICEDALVGDLYSTAFFLMPLDEVMEYVESIDGLDVYIVDSNNTIIKSSGFDRYLSK